MTKTFTYADAVRLLGADDVSGIGWIDRIMGGTDRSRGIGLRDLLACFGLPNEVVRAGRALVRGVEERRQGLSRFDRTERIHAAHAVIVISAYFEALRGADLPFSLDQLELTKSEQATMVTGRPAQSGKAGALVGELLDSAIPLPTPQRPREVTVGLLRTFYAGLSGRLVQFAEGLAAWEGQSASARRQFSEAVHVVPAAACERYEALLRELATAFAEVANWANLQDHEATRGRIDEVHTALGRLEQLLNDVSAGVMPQSQLSALTRAYRAYLDQPIVAPGDEPEQLRIPVLGEAYVDPRFRVADVPLGSTPSEETWWRDVPVRDDFNAFLAGYLTSPQATQAPLLVLGQPGSGKSVLTKVLAARLPPTDFLVVHVVLREISADMDLQEQVEQAIRNETGERVEWPAYVRSAGNALPVVLLDGFDEMLQATGVSQTDYLVKVRAFQLRESIQKRPVVAVVTSRTTVANRARIPDDTVAVRLEPFSAVQVAEWLTMWQDANEQYFRERGLTALPAPTALKYPDLAEQPLLLLMLALYDADNNMLRNNEGEFSRADLYERLLVRFARREMAKTGERHETRLNRAVEDGLNRLSVVALAMFNRVSHFVSEEDLERDLASLYGDRPAGGGHGFRAPLGAAERVLGEFFFIQESQATRGERRLRTYEFLHATFGEYLAARLLFKILVPMVARDASDEWVPFDENQQDDGRLFELLSFAPLSSRPSVIGFLTDVIAGMSDTGRRSLINVLVKLFMRAQEGRDDRGHSAYEPRRLPVVSRHALYTANLVILVVIAKREVQLVDLFRGGRPDVRWLQYALFWRSQMSGSEYEGLVNSLAVRRKLVHDGPENRLEVRLAFDDGNYAPDPIELDQAYYRSANVHPSESGTIFVSTDQHPDALRRWALFGMTRSDAVMLHVLEPLVEVLKETVNSFVRWPGEQLRSAAHLLMQVIFLPGGTVDDETVAQVYRRCAEIATLERSPWSARVQDRFCTLLLDRLRVDDRVAPAVVDDVLTLMSRRQGMRTQLVRCALGVLGRDRSSDQALVAKLQAVVEPEWVQRESVVALEAWLRLVEVELLDGVQGFLGSAGAFFRCVDPTVVAAVRPDLMTRARWAVADRGCGDELPEAWVTAFG